MTDSGAAHDAVIVGGGHNGLIAGCYLARAGLDVVVVEQRDWLGGMAASRAFVPEAPEHKLSPGAYENVYLRAAGVARELGLARFGYRELEAAGWAWIGPAGESLVLQRDLRRTVEAIARFSGRDAGRYRELVEVGVRLLRIQDRYGLDHPRRPSLGTVAVAARALAGDRRVRALLGALLTGTAADVIESTFESAALRGILAGTGTILSPLTTEGSAIAVLAPCLIHHRGAARPVGGMGGLITALERCLSFHGGSVRTGTAAVAIGGADRADTVVLADGTTLRARQAVVASCPPQLVPELTREGLPDDVAARLRRAPANATGVGTFTVNLALSGLVELPDHRRTDVSLRRPALFAGTFEDILSASAQAARGQLPARTTYCLAILTAVDPSQAPTGQDVLQLYAPAPVSPDGGWATCRENAAARLVAAASQAAPALEALEIGRYVETPEDLAARTGAINGCIYHVDHVPTRMGPLRPALGAGGYRIPLPGLYLGSAGSHPGGGVSGLPGKLCAMTVLRDLRRNQRRPHLRRSPSPTRAGTSQPARNRHHSLSHRHAVTGGSR